MLCGTNSIIKNILICRLNIDVWFNEEQNTIKTKCSKGLENVFKSLFTPHSKVTHKLGGRSDFNSNRNLLMLHRRFANVRQVSLFKSNRLLIIVLGNQSPEEMHLHRSRGLECIRVRIRV